MFGNLITKMKGLAQDVKDHWDTPREGEYVANKEIKNLAVGSVGCEMVSQATRYLGFMATILLVGAIYKISFRDIYIVGLINMPFSFIYNPINMVVTDNLGHVPKKTMRRINMYLIPTILIGFGLFFLPTSTLEFIVPAFPQVLASMLFVSGLAVYYRQFVYLKLSPKFGKFRCFIIVGWLPCLLSLGLIVYMPFESMAYASRLWLLNTLFGVFGVFKSYAEQRGSMQNIISPNTHERVKITTLNTLFMAPVNGILESILPVLAMLTGGMTNILTYRTIFPAVLFLSGPFLMFMAFGVKDKVYLEVKHTTNLGMFTGLKEVIKNKYQWILNISDLLGTVSANSVNILTMIFVYYMRQDWLLGIATMIMGFCGFPGLIFAPWLIKKMSKRNVILVSRLLYYSYFICAFIALNTGVIFLLFVGMALSNIFNSAGNIARDTMNPDIWDYQQYISGKRLESSMGLIGLICTPFSTLIAMIVPFVYVSIGFTNDWNMFYVPEMMNKIFTSTLLLLLAGHTLSIIPYFFYDLNEDKHKKIIDILKERKEQLDKAELSFESANLNSISLNVDNYSESEFSSNINDYNNFDNINDNSNNNVNNTENEYDKEDN